MIRNLKGVIYVSLILRGPDSLPGTRGMLAFCLIPWAVVNIASNLAILPPAPALIGAALELLLLFAYTQLVLRLAGKLARMPQTLVSLIGVQAIIVFLNLPFTLNYRAEGQEQAGFLVGLVEAGFVAWWLVAMANIFSRSVDRSLRVGVALAVGHFIFSLMMYGFLLGAMGVKPGAS